MNEYILAQGGKEAGHGQGQGLGIHSESPELFSNDGKDLYRVAGGQSGAGSCGVGSKPWR